MPNPFDQFDMSEPKRNPFDQFDLAPVADPGQIVHVRPQSSSGALAGGIGPSYDANANKMVRVPAGAAAAPQDPLAAEADQRVADEAKAHPYGRAVDDFILNLLRGTPIGSYTDELSAGMSAGEHALTGGLLGEPYDKAKAYEDARVRALDKNSTTLATVPTPLGDIPITTGGLTKLAGGVATAPFAPGLKLMKGATLFPSTVNAAATGAGYGGLYGSGEGDSLGDRAENAFYGAEIGGGLGAMAPAVSQGAGNIAGAVTNALKPMPTALSGFHPQAIKNIAKAVQADNVQVNPQGTAVYTQPNGQPLDLGPNGMLMDLGQTLQAHASGLAARPDTTAIISKPLQARTAAAPQRVQAAVNNAFGPPQNVPELLDRTTQFFNGEAKPFYDQFHATSIPVDPELSGILSDIKSAIPGAVSKAERLAKGDGYKEQFRLHQVDEPMTAMTGTRKTLAEKVPTGIEYDYLKRAVDNAARSEKQGSNEQRIYANLARNLRNAIDARLSPSNPAESPWAKARSLAGEGINAKEAMQEGQKAFQKNISPDQLAYDLQGQSAVERGARLIGARSAIANAMGNKATAFGPKGDTAARQMFNSEFGKEKAEMLAGPGQTQRLLNRIERENVMAATANEVLGNSRTALRTEVNKLYPNPLDKTKPYPLGIEQVPSAIANKMVEKLTNEAITEKSIKIATDAARMLVKQGADRDALVRALYAHIRSGNLSNRQRTAVTRIANTLMHGSIGTAISANQPSP